MYVACDSPFSHSVSLFLSFIDPNRMKFCVRPDLSEREWNRFSQRFVCTPSSGKEYNTYNTQTHTHTHFITLERLRTNINRFVFRGNYTKTDSLYICRKCQIIQRVYRLEYSTCEDLLHFINCSNKVRHSDQ